MSIDDQIPAHLVPGFLHGDIFLVEFSQAAQNRPRNRGDSSVWIDKNKPQSGYFYLATLEKADTPLTAATPRRS